MTDVEEKLMEHTARMDALWAIRETQTQLLEKVTATLYGNGKEGLVTTTSNHTQTLKVLTGVLWAMASVLISLGLKAVFDKLVLWQG